MNNPHEGDSKNKLLKEVKSNASAYVECSIDEILPEQESHT